MMSELLMLHIQRLDISIISIKAEKPLSAEHNCACFSPKLRASGHYLSSCVCATLDKVQVAGLLGFSSATLNRRIQLCNLT